jgi:hypothetical protein
MSKCVENIVHSKIKVEEQGRKAIFLNPNNEVCQRGKIDSCLVTEGIRADYFVSNSTKSILVELKGCNIAHACDQLFAAVEHQNVRPLLKDKIGFVVICTRVPAATTATQLAQQKARRQYGAQFKVFCNQRELNFDDF